MVDGTGDEKPLSSSRGQLTKKGSGPKTVPWDPVAITCAVNTH